MDRTAPVISHRSLRDAACVLGAASLAVTLSTLVSPVLESVSPTILVLFAPGLLVLGLIVTVVPPLPCFVLGVFLLLSPISRDGNSSQSSLIAILTLVITSGSLWLHPRHRASLPPTRLILPAAALAGLGLVYGVLAFGAHVLLWYILWDLYPVVELLAFLLVAWTTLRSPLHVRQLLLAMILAATLRAAFDIWVFATGSTIWLIDVGSILLPRILDTPSFLLIPVIAAQLAAAPLSRRSMPLGIALAVILVALLLSFTRSFWLGLLLAVPAMAMVQMPSARRRAALLVLAGLALATMAIAILPVLRGEDYFDLFLSRVDSTFAQLAAPSNTSASVRQDETRVAVQAVLDSNLLGTFPGSSLPSALLLQTQLSNDTGLHNYYLQVLLKFGLPGLTLFAVFIYAVARHLRRSIDSTSPPTVALATGVVGLLTMEAIQLLTYSATVSFHVGAVVAVCLALTRTWDQSDRGYRFHASVTAGKQTILTGSATLAAPTSKQAAP